MGRLRYQRQTMLLTSQTRLPAVLLLSLYLAGNLVTHAQLPLARLSTIFPPGGRTGTTLEVNLTGADLDDCSRLLFSHTNIVATPKVNGTSHQPEPNKFTVVIAPDVPAGVYEARAIGRFGISNPRSFVVGDVPEVTVQTNNHSRATAASIPLGTVVNGHADSGAVDFFKFTARKAQRVLIECQSHGIDSRMQDVLVLTDASGREIARNRRGGLLDFTASSEGEYVVEVHDVTYRNGPEYFYRLALNTSPHIDWIFPPSGQPGTKTRFTLFGRNLPGGTLAKDRTIDGQPLETLDVEVELSADRLTYPHSFPDLALPPAGADVDAITYRLVSSNGVSNPALLGIATGPVIPEQEPNDTRLRAQKVSIPCEFVGQFYPANDQDWISFDAKKGEVYRIEVFSHRLGLPTDPFVVVQHVTRNDKGEEKFTDALELNDADTNIGGPEFNTSSRDPSGKFEVKDDGTYRLCIRDRFNRSESNPRLVYRLSLRKESPDFRLVTLPHPPPPANKDTREALVWSPFLRRGETFSIKVLAFRRDGFQEPILLNVEGLPPSVSCAPARIEADKSSTFIFLTASADAESWYGPVRVVGRAKAGDVELVREARAGATIWTVPDYNNEAVQSRTAADLYLAVSAVEPAPISVQPGESKVYEATAGAKLQIPLKIDRHWEFNETLKFKAVGSAALESLKELEVDGKTNSATLEIDLAQIKLPAGTHTLELQSQTKGKYRNNPDAAKEAEETAKQAEKQANDLVAEAKKATEALTAASKASDDAVARLKSVSESDRSAAETEVKQTADSKTTAEQASVEAAAKAKQADEKKQALQKRAKELGDKAAPREVTITVYSAPITIEVKPEEKKPEEKK